MLTSALALLIAVALNAAELSTEPVKWFDADSQSIPEPAEIVENQIWDIADHTLFFQIGKVLDLGWTARRLGNILHVAPPREADNTNRLEEVPGSAWYTNRHFLHPMTLEELRQGPGYAHPDDSGPWQIVKGKFEGGTAGFTIKDAAGTYYVLKFDSEGNNEMGSSIVGLYEMVSNIMDFQFTSAVFHFLEGADAKAHLFRIFAFTNWIALFVQLLLTSFVMVRFGVGVALLFLPIAALIGSGGFLVVPVLLFGSLLNTCDNGFSYSINQSAKEVLYVPTTKEEKYKAKAFIDMFIQRFAKALAVGLSLIMTTIFSGFDGIRWLSVVTLVILIAWIAAARYAGREFSKKESSSAPAS